MMSFPRPSGKGDFSEQSSSPRRLDSPSPRTGASRAVAESRSLTLAAVGEENEDPRELPAGGVVRISCPHFVRCCP
jgi:hypothetical protein